MRPRVVRGRLPDPSERTLVVLTGARQVGKTTLARERYPGLRYLSLDSSEDRDALAAMRARAWGREVGVAVLDEAQKEPAIFEKIKLAFDAREIDFSVLLGSAQIGLLRQTAETLAGRALIYEMWPLLLSELAAAEGSVRRPLLARLVETPDPAGLLAEEPERWMADREEGPLRALEHLESWGGMPRLLALGDERRRDWLRSYTQTYLERDLADLARLSDLRPFRTFQRVSALRSARLLSFADLARDAGVSPTTARSYLEYLRISYQAFLLEPYFENLTSRVVKAPKLYWTDLGILRELTGQRGVAQGELFETLVVAEVVKWLRTTSSDTRAYFYRTRSGLEVDLLLESPHGLLGIEIKGRPTPSPSDTRSLRQLALAAGTRWLAGLVVHRGRSVQKIDRGHRLWAVPVHRLLA